MPKTYQIAPDYVFDLARDIIATHHLELQSAGVTVEILFAFNEDGHAVELGGYPCQAVAKIVNLKDRAKGCKDAEIVVDADNWDSLGEKHQRALMDHELHHFAVVLDKYGRAERDDLHRPKLEMRKHDIQAGWFAIIARRHGAFSAEVRQAQSIVANYRQVFFPFLDGVDVPEVAEDDMMPERYLGVQEPQSYRATAELPFIEKVGDMLDAAVGRENVQRGIAMTMTTGERSVTVTGEQLSHIGRQIEEHAEEVRRGTRKTRKPVPATA